MHGSPPSRLKGVLEALTFVRHILGIVKLDGCITSRRCMGEASSREITVVRQADALKVSHLQCFHKILSEDPEIWNRVFCGMVLFCVYARSRWSDAQHSEKLLEDRDDCAILNVRWESTRHAEQFSYDISFCRLFLRPMEL